MDANDQGAESVPSGDPYIVAHPFSRPFWAAAAKGVLLLPLCGSCERTHWYPRPFCPLCGHRSIEWVRASGRATVHAYSEMARAAQPYTVAYVRLDEGPLMLTNLLGGEPGQEWTGMRVQVQFVPAAEGRKLPIFAAATP